MDPKVDGWYSVRLGVTANTLVGLEGRAEP